MNLDKLIKRDQEYILRIIPYIPTINECQSYFNESINPEDIAYWGLCYILRTKFYNIFSTDQKEIYTSMRLLRLIAKEISKHPRFKESKSYLDSKAKELSNELWQSSVTKRRSKNKTSSSI